MKVIVAGCRDFNNYDYLKAKLSILLSNFKPNDLEIVSGGAKGADALGERFAREFGIKVKVFKAEWKKYGNRAGPLRNEEMAKYADVLVAFWDNSSPGTKNMITNMNKEGKPLRIVNINNRY